MTNSVSFMTNSASRAVVPSHAKVVPTFDTVVPVVPSVLTRHTAYSKIAHGNGGQSCLVVPDNSKGDVR